MSQQGLRFYQALTDFRTLPDPMRCSKGIRWPSWTHAIEQWDHGVRIGVIDTTLSQ